MSLPRSKRIIFGKQSKSIGQVSTTKILLIGQLNILLLCDWMTIKK
jgi:hypothetical protein